MVFRWIPFWANYEVTFLKWRNFHIASTRIHKSPSHTLTSANTCNRSFQLTFSISNSIRFGPPKYWRLFKSLTLMWHTWIPKPVFFRKDDRECMGELNSRIQTIWNHNPKTTGLEVFWVTVNCLESTSIVSWKAKGDHMSRQRPRNRITSGTWLHLLPPINKHANHGRFSGGVFFVCSGQSTQIIRKE